MERTMAEAAVETPAVRFFCHKCSQEINPVLPDYICPRCQSGFIEELTQGPNEPPGDDSDEDLDQAAQFTELWNNTLMDVLRRLDRATGESSTDPHHHHHHHHPHVQDGSNSSTSSTSSAPSGEAVSQRTRQRVFGRQMRRPVSDHGRPPLEGIIHQIFANLTGGAGFISGQGLPVFVNLHGNPGDYAWGRGGLDAVITQLLNQLDGTGPPPLPKEKIEEIPTVQIVQDQVEKSLQCTVCMEDFRTGEPVKRLSCQHHFHTECIIPWLELHGTCPICRKLLNDEMEENVMSDVDLSVPTSQGAPPPTAGTTTGTSGSTSGSSSYNQRQRQQSEGSRPFNPSNEYSVYDFNEECD